MQNKPYLAPFLSFFSASLYRSVGREWGGLAFGYLAVVIVFITSVFGLYIQMGANNVFGKEIPRIMNQVPDFKIEEGILEAKVEMPYEIKDPKTGDLIGVMDTREGAEIPETVPLRITRSELTVERNQIETRTIKFEQLPTFDKKMLLEWISTISGLFVPGFVIAFLICAIIFAYIQVLIYALFGMLFSKLLKVDLGYPALVRLSAVSITPVILIDLILKLTSTNFVVWPILAMTISLVYLFFGVRANQTTDSPVAV